MSPQMLELALRKQRLQFRAESERADMMRRLAGMEAMLDRVDQVRDQLHWAREKIPLFSAAAVLVLLALPRLSWRLARRAWFSWMLLRKLRGGAYAPLLPLLFSALRRWRGARAARG